jgi:hypothetical protein
MRPDEPIQIITKAAEIRRIITVLLEGVPTKERASPPIRQHRNSLQHLFATVW